MTPSAQSIAQNTTWLTSAFIFQKIFAFIYFTLIARWIGASDIGSYVFAISLASILSVFIDFGLSPVLIREASKDKEKANLYLNNILSLKIILAIITFILAVIIINLLDKPPLIKTMVYLAGCVMVVDSFVLSFWGIFRAWQNLRYEATSLIINQLLILGIGLSGVILKFPLYVLVIALLCGSIFNLIYSFLLLKIKLNFVFKLSWNREVIKTLFLIALPFALAGIFTRIYTYIDQILLSILIGDQALGWYSVAYKITYALQFIPAAFAATLFPAMSNYYQTDMSKLKLIFEQSMYLLIILCLPIAFGVLTLADKFIVLLYTAEYWPAILTLQVFIFAIIAIFLSYPVGSILNACNKQNTNTINLGISMIVNVILNIILIPKFQHLGAAIAALTSLSLLFILNLYWVPKIIKFDYNFLFIKLLKSFLSALIMSLTILYLKPTVHVIFLIIIGAVIYSLLMIVTRGVKISDIKYLWQAAWKKTKYEENIINNN